MNYLATVLYEDSHAVGSGKHFAPHDLVLAMVADRTGRDIFELRRLVDKNPRRGVDKLIRDLSRTTLLAGPGKLCVVVDRDELAKKVNLPHGASDAQLANALRERSDAPDRVSVHLLRPNMEGLLRAVEECHPGSPAPTRKDPNARDIYLNKVAFSQPVTVRDCVKGKQPGLAALVDLLVELSSPALPVIG